MIEIFKELKKKIHVTYAEVTGSTTYLGRRLEIRKDEVIFGVDPKYVENILEEIGLRDLKGVMELKCERDKNGENVEMEGLGQAEFRSLVGKMMWKTVRTPGRQSGRSRRSWVMQLQRTARTLCTYCAT